MISLLGTALVLMVIVMIGEFLARAAGFHRPLLYEATPYGYRVKPSQEFLYLGRRARYNAFGLRSDSVEAHPKPGVTRILCVGDSITNGGLQTDQAHTFPYLLERLLAQAGHSVEVLNISANGWALENEEGWMRENGILGSQIVLWQVATHDMNQRMASSQSLDTHVNFPSQPPRLALAYALRRYVLPAFRGGISVVDPGATFVPYSEHDIERSVKVLSRGRALVENAEAKLMVWHIAQPAPLEPDSELARLAKQKLECWAVQSGVSYLSVEKTLNEAGGTRLFRDGLHPAPDGNRIIAETLAQFLFPALPR